MDDNKILIGVVLLGIVAIVMVGLVAKIALQESQLANMPQQVDTLRRQNAPGTHRTRQTRTELAHEAATGGGARSPMLASSTTPETTSPMAPKPTAPKSVKHESAAAQASSTDSANSTSTSGSDTPTNSDESLSENDQFKAGEAPSPANLENAGNRAAASLVRMIVVDHKEEQRTGVAMAMDANGLLLTHAPLLAGGYEAVCLLPESRRKSSAVNRCVMWSPETNLALVRVDEKDDPIAPLPRAKGLPKKGDRLVAMFDMGQLDFDRSDLTVTALLSTADVEKKLQRKLAQFGDALWIEATGLLPENIAGSPLINEAAELAGIAMVDVLPAVTQAGRSQVFGGGGGVGGLIPSGVSKVNRQVYALAPATLEPLLTKSTSPSNDLLFTLPAVSLQKPRRAARANWTVKLASGEPLDAKTFEIPAPRPSSGTLSCSGARCATLALSDRKVIDGPLTVADKEGREVLKIVFDQGRRHGSMMALDGEGRCVLAAQFQRDQRHGYCAYFRDGAPWLIQEYAEGKLGAQHLVKQGAVFHTLEPGQSLETVNAVLARYGDWARWDQSLTAMEVNIERWAKEVTKRTNRSNEAAISDAQQDAVAAVENFRKLVN